jgi:hypothetical protein
MTTITITATECRAYAAQIEQQLTVETTERWQRFLKHELASWRQMAAERS